MAHIQYHKIYNSRTDVKRSEDNFQLFRNYPAACPLVLDRLSCLHLSLADKVCSMLHVVLYYIDKLTLRVRVRGEGKDRGRWGRRIEGGEGGRRRMKGRCCSPL